jgi:hypothetical protein
MEKEIEKTVRKIAQDKDRLDINTEQQQQQQPIELDEKELKKYVDFVIREVKKEGKGSSCNVCLSEERSTRSYSRRPCRTTSQRNKVADFKIKMLQL